MIVVEREDFYYIVCNYCMGTYLGLVVIECVWVTTLIDFNSREGFSKLKER
jgi:hypothetical protein